MSRPSLRGRLEAVAVDFVRLSYLPVHQEGLPRSYLSYETKPSCPTCHAFMHFVGLGSGRKSSATSNPSPHHRRSPGRDATAT